MTTLALYCKSYSTDLRRLVRLAESVKKFNVEGLPFYVSVPDSELALFQEHLAGYDVHLMTDSDILRASPRIDREQMSRFPGSLSQQIVKSEFWRLGLSDAYLCLDSDAVFIRPFGRADFMTAEGTPYTMLDEAHDLLEDALRQGRERVISDFHREADQVQALFDRPGRRYSFGPFPLVWHQAVWQSLDERFLQPRGMSFADAIKLAPIESRWYGEALLAYQAVPLRPCQALFKVYHYAWQLDQDHRRGVTEDMVANMYAGVIYQSAWERNMDWPSEGGNWLSQLSRRLRRKLGRI
ncbi:MAG: DUF6492 family protein [Limnohabitans sp.]